MPLALFAAMPPIFAVSIDAGSGPILRAYGSRRRLASAPMTPGCSAIVAPSALGWQSRQPSPSTTSTESLIAWPDRLVPAARKVSGTRASRHKPSTRTSSVSSSTTTTSCGTSR